MDRGIESPVFSTPLFFLWLTAHRHNRRDRPSALISQSTIFVHESKAWPNGEGLGILCAMRRSFEVQVEVGMEQL